MCQDLEIDSDFVERGGANGFAGGLGNTGAVCGAVAGAVMAIGLKRGRTETMEGMLETAAVVQEFRRRFEAETGTISCRELTGVDLTTRAGIQEFMNSDRPQTACFPAVSLAYSIVVDLLEENSPSGSSVV